MFVFYYLCKRNCDIQFYCLISHHCATNRSFSHISLKFMKIHDSHQCRDLNEQEMYSLTSIHVWCDIAVKPGVTTEHAEDISSTAVGIGTYETNYISCCQMLGSLLKALQSLISLERMSSCTVDFAVVVPRAIGQAAWCVPGCFLDSVQNSALIICCDSFQLCLLTCLLHQFTQTTECPGLAQKFSFNFFFAP